jgi:two-component system NtrC family response regulator
MKANILVVDDESEVRNVLSEVLSLNDYKVAEADSVGEVQKAFNGGQPDVIVLDVKLGPSKEEERAGLDLLPQIKKRWPDTEVIVLTGQGTNEMAMEAGRRGAYNFLSKPFEAGKLLADVKCALEKKEQAEENRALFRAYETVSGSTSPIFRSAAMQTVVRTVERVAPSDVTILITGESGSGKEVIADLIHSLSTRSKARIIKINCAALPRELIESELFGSVKGAFTGAHSDRDGLFRQAEGGTLFLDEISEMPIDTQSKLLRVLQDQEVRPVGGKVSYKTNCRLVAATNRKPEDAIKDGKMREDLFYRISAISVHLAPLRERRDDIMPLANAFMKKFSSQANRPIRGFTAAAIERLSGFDWPGNVRQLQNEVQRAVLLSEGDEVDAADLSISKAKASDEETLDTNYTLLEGVERNAIVQMLKDTGGNKLETAKRLGIGRQTLYNKIKNYGIEV